MPALNIRRNVIFSVGELITNLLLVFVTYRILVRHGGVEMLGLWSTLLAWLSIARLGDFGVGGAVTRYVAGLDASLNKPQVLKYVHTGIISSLAIYAVLVGIFGVLGAFFLEAVSGAEYFQAAKRVFPWMLAGLLANNLASIILSTLVALHFGYQRSVVTVAGNLLQLCLAAILIPSYGLVGFAIAQLVQFLLSAVAGWWLVCRALGYFHLRLNFHRSVLREMLSFSLSLQVTSVTNALFEPLSKVLISHFGGLYMQGIYEAAYKTVYLARNVAVQASTATIPAMTRFAQNDLVQAKALYQRTVANLRLAMVGIAIAVGVGAPLISQFWFGRMEADYLLFVGILGLGAIASGLSAAAYNIGLATGRLFANNLISSLGLVVLAAAGFALGQAGAPQGIVWLASAIAISNSVLIVIFNRRLLGLDAVA